MRLSVSAIFCRVERLTVSCAVFCMSSARFSRILASSRSVTECSRAMRPSYASRCSSVMSTSTRIFSQTQQYSRTHNFFRTIQVWNFLKTNTRESHSLHILLAVYEPVSMYLRLWWLHVCNSDTWATSISWIQPSMKQTDRQTDLECNVALISVRSKWFDIEQWRLAASVDLTSCRVNTAQRCQVPLTSERRLLAYTTTQSAVGISSEQPVTASQPESGLIGPIPWGHSGPLCYTLSLLSSSLCTSHAACTIAIAGYWWLTM